MKFNGSTALCVGFFLATTVTASVYAQNAPAYLDPGQPVDARVSDLLSQMTLDEKIGQMVQADLDCVTNLADIQTYGFGSMLSGGDSKPVGANEPENWLNTKYR
jgi:beta-glucosidase